MKTAEKIRERLAALQDAKEQLLFPPQAFTEARVEVRIEVDNPDNPFASPWEYTRHIESLNAEIAALTWVLEVAK